MLKFLSEQVGDGGFRSETEEPDWPGPPPIKGKDSVMKMILDGIIYTFSVST